MALTISLCSATSSNSVRWPGIFTRRLSQKRIALKRRAETRQRQLEPWRSSKGRPGQPLRRSVPLVRPSSITSPFPMMPNHLQACKLVCLGDGSCIRPCPRDYRSWSLPTSPGERVGHPVFFSSCAKCAISLTLSTKTGCQPVYGVPFRGILVANCVTFVAFRVTFVPLETHAGAGSGRGGAEAGHGHGHGRQTPTGCGRKGRPAFFAALLDAIPLSAGLSTGFWQQPGR